jgi:hypothetical protein
MTRKTLVGIMLVVVIAVAASVVYFRYAGVPSPFESEQEREVREDSGLRHESVPIGLSFIWTPDLSADMLLSHDLKRLLFRANRMFHDSIGVYVWLYRSAVWETPVEDIYHTGEGLSSGCSDRVYTAVTQMYGGPDLPIVIVRQIRGDHTLGLTCIRVPPQNPLDPLVDMEQYASTGYVVLSLEGLSSENGYRVLVHELLHAFGPRLSEGEVEGLFPVDIPSVTSLPNSYQNPVIGIIELGSARFIVPFPEDYDAFS